MGLIDELAEAGVDVDDALKRFVGNSALYERMVKKLPEAVEKYDTLKYFNLNDYENALLGAHSLKGVMGNLSITTLFKEYSEVVSLLRNNEMEKAKSVYEKVIPIENNIMSIIKKYL